MNKELMMKAAIQFKGVWPREEGRDRLAVCIEDTLNNGSGDISIVHYNFAEVCWEIFCTREQFKSFVESLFEGAPDDAEFYSFENGGHPASFWRSVVQGLWYIWPLDRLNKAWLVSFVNPDDDEAIELIPRPAKKLYIGDTPEQLKKGVTPQAPYMPKVGEECEYMIDEGLWFPCFYIGINSNGECVIEKRTGCFEVLISNKFRPIKTEREKFIDDHKAEVYLYAINTSELISMKQSTGEDLAARVLGYMHDAGFKSP